MFPENNTFVVAYYGPNKAYSRKSRQAVPAIFREFEGVFSRGIKKNMLPRSGITRVFLYPRSSRDAQTVVSTVCRKHRSSSWAQSLSALDYLIAPTSPTEAQVCANWVALRKSVVLLAPLFIYNTLIFIVTSLVLKSTISPVFSVNFR